MHARALSLPVVLPLPGPFIPVLDSSHYFPLPSSLWPEEEGNYRFQSVSFSKAHASKPYNL